MAVEVACDEGDRCAQDAPVPACVPADALPCEPSDDIVRCQNGLKVVCDADSGYLTSEPCEPGYICTGDEFPECQQMLGINCSVNQWVPLCVNRERVICNPDNRRLDTAGSCRE